MDSHSETKSARTGVQLTVLYDNSCAWCYREWVMKRAKDFGDLVEAVAIQSSSELLARHNIAAQDAMDALHVITADGRIFRGPEAFRVYERLLGQRFGWRLTSRAPLRQIADVIYVLFARNRQWLSRLFFPFWKPPQTQCELPPRQLEKPPDDKS